MLQSLDSSIVTAIGSFPATTTTDSLIDSLLDWSLLEDAVKNNASEIIDKNFAHGIRGNGNFATALLQLTKIIQASDHPYGTVIVILKAEPAESLGINTMILQKLYQTI